MTTMQMTEEQQQVRELAREFATSALRPNVERWDHDRTLDEGVLAQVAELGFFGMRTPEEHGGMGFDLPTYLGALEELAWGEPSLALAVSASVLVAELLHTQGADAQKTRWLESLASGATVACFALAEADAGSDEAAVATTAERSGAGWVLRGSKKWVSNARAAQLALVLARSEGEGLALFLVPTDAQGVRVGARENTMGLRPLEIATLELDGVELGGDALLGAPGNGLELAHGALENGRLGVAAISVGIAQAALDHARGYAAEREQFGRKIREFEAIQYKLADMATRTAAARALTAHIAANPTPAGASMAKLFASETAMWVTTEAVQIYGGYGYMRDYPVEKLMRDAKAMEILEGTSDMLRLVIAEELYA